jgi:hypothetical protein
MRRLNMRPAEVAGNAYASVVSAARSMPSVFLSAILAQGILIGGARVVRGLLPSAHHTSMFSGELASPFVASFGIDVALAVVAFLFQAIVASPLIVAIHRFILLNEVNESFISSYTSRAWKIVLWLIGYQLVIHISDLAKTLTGGRAVLFALVSLIPLYPLSLTILVFPSLAANPLNIGFFQRVKNSTNNMLEHFGLFFRSLIATCVPLVIGFSIISLTFAEEKSIGLNNNIANIVQFLFQICLTVFGIALAASMVSWVFVEIEGA